MSGNRRHTNHYRDPVIGSCWKCKGPLTRSNSATIKDATIGGRRRVHRGQCFDEAERLINAGKGKL